MNNVAEVHCALGVTLWNAGEQRASGRIHVTTDVKPSAVLRDTVNEGFGELGTHHPASALCHLAMEAQSHQV